MVKWLIEEGANVGAKNTSGQTFLHVAHPAQFKVTSEIIELLQLLAKHNFPLLHRDYHGQSPADVFFMAVNPSKLSYEHLEIIVSHLQPYAYELSCLASHLERSEPFAGHESLSEEPTDEGLRSKKQQGALLALCRKPIQSFNCFLESSLEIWAKLPDVTHLVRELDSNGDSALIHMVKEWPKKNDERKLESIIEELVKLGAEVDMRDRRGDTALAIATRRGLRPAVRALLALGANPDTRCYRGDGIIFQTVNYLIRAKKEDSGKQYSMILSCLSLLIDFGAKENPTVYDEWRSLDIIPNLNTGGLLNQRRNLPLWQTAPS
jgi:ankyrin repeat protein